MGILTGVIKTAARALAITESTAARIAAKHGREGLVRGLDALSDLLDGRRLPQSTLTKLPPELLSTLTRTLDKRIHGQSKPPVIDAAAGFRTRSLPKPATVGGRNNEPPLPGQEVEQIYAPDSSNVYSLSFDRPAGSTTGDLFITYRAVNINRDAVSKGSQRRGKSKSLVGLVGTSGKTVAGGKRENRPGSRYVYRKVPASVWARLREAHSKGEEIWRSVRVKGSIFGHRYSYQLVSPDVQVGLQASYVPRRATAAGFKTRSLNVMGGGFLASTLPAGSNTVFSTRPAPGGRRGR